MWFNSMQSEEPYLGLTWLDMQEVETGNGDDLLSQEPAQVVHGCRQLVP